MPKSSLPTLNETQVILKPFTFYGNEGTAKVKKYNTQGDGDIWTGGGGQVRTTVTARLSQISPSIVRLNLQYHVWESSWEKGESKSDRLYFDAYQDFNVADFSKTSTYKDPDNPNATITEVVTCQLTDSCKNEAFYKDSFQTKDKRLGWLRLDKNSYPAVNRPQSWLLTGKTQTDALYVKIDGSGSELTEKGNIGVSGYVKFSLKVTRTRTKFVPDEAIVSNYSIPPKAGNHSVLPTIPNKVKNVLGRGYMIDGEYANSNSLAEGFVLDLNLLNQYKRIEHNTNTSYDGEVFEGNGSKEYKTTMQESLGVKVSASAFGVSFSNETKKTFSEERSGKEEYKMMTVKDVICYELFRIQGYGRPVDLGGFLDSQFKADLNRLTPYDLVRKYGTHVVLGMKMGARLFYNMSYQRSLSSISTARTFSTSTSISYNMGTGSFGGKAEPKKSYYEQLIEKGLDGTLQDAKVIDALQKVIAASQQGKADAAKSGGSKPGGISVSVGVDYSTSSTSSETNEEATTEIRCTGVGGDVKYFKKIEGDPIMYDTWLNTVSPATSDWCDFVKDTLIPIYEFIPAGYKIDAASCKKAWEQYLLDKCPKMQPIGKRTIFTDFKMEGKSIVSNYAKNVLKNDEDGDIYTKSGRDTGWRVRFELVNVENTVAVNVSLMVFEGGLNANRSILQLFDNKYITTGSAGRLAANPSVSPVCEFEGKYTGEQNDWIDITNEAAKQKCPFLDTNSSRLYIKIDGKGEDYGNIAIMGRFKVPVIEYAK